MDDPGLLEAGVAVVDLAQEIGDERRGGADLGKGEEARAQAVVDVVGVVGDVVGERRRLRLEAGVEGEVERLQAIVGEDRRRRRRARGSARSARPRR